MGVSVFVRKPGPTSFSLERVCADVIGAMPEGVGARVLVMPHRTRGFGGLLTNMAYARRRAGEVNHVFGHIHYVACVLPAKRTLLTVADCTPLMHRSGLRRGVIRRVWYTWPIRHSALVATISESTRQELLRLVGCSPEKVCVVHVPVSDVFSFAPKVFDVAYPAILQVGTKANKNLRRVAQALQGVRCRLRIIGRITEGQSAALRECGIDHSSAADLSHEQMVAEYQDCDMLVLASTYEGFGLPIVEAQATGRPVVTSSVCSMPEVAGGAAELVDPLDVADIRRGMLRVIGDGALRRTLVEAGLENVRRFRPETIATKYVGLYEELRAR